MAEPQEKQFLGHPRVLFMLFFVEMWERFSYYGMRALLVLYMVKSLKFADSKAYAIYAAYCGLVYMTPLIGGMLADRLLGNQIAIITGCLLMAIGHFFMAVEQPVFFYGALGLLIIGNGYFKANMSTLIGKLYEQNDPRRDGGYTIFYMGVNLGAFLAPLVCGMVGEVFGWHYGFGLAGIGMCLGLFIFTSNRKALGDRGVIPNPEALKEPGFAGLNKKALLYLGTIISIPVAALLVNQAEWIKIFIPVFGGIFLVYIIYEAMRSTPAERGQIFTILILMIFTITFWACFEQAGSSINLFTDRFVDRSINPITIPIINKTISIIPVTAFQSINPLFIIILGIPFAMLWSYLGRTRYNPASPIKMSLGFILLALGFLVLAMAANTVHTGNVKASMLLLILVYFLHTTGELCLSPVGLSVVSKLSPARISALLMGAWMLSMSFANVLAGILASLTSMEAGSAETLTNVIKYKEVFIMIVKIGIGTGIALLVFTPLLKKLAGRKF